jgi:WD40 repeat protein
LKTAFYYYVSQALVLPGDKYEVTYLASSPNKKYLAAGYSDGTVKVFDLKSGDNITSFSGHRGAITCLTYDAVGHRLASGAQACVDLNINSVEYKIVIISNSTTKSPS